MPKLRTLAEMLSETRALHVVRNVAKLRIAKAKRASLAPREPLAAIAAYQAAAEAYAGRVERLVEKHVLSRLPVLGSGDPLNRWGLELGLARLQADMLELAQKMRRPARSAGLRGEKHAAREVGRMLGLKVPRDARAAFLAEDFAAANVLLFQRISAAQCGRIRKAIAEHQEGDSLRADILHTLWVSRNRSKLIASDQVHKLQAEQIEFWSRGGGSSHYVYVTAGDERVRSSHREHDGKVFAWDAPPSTGHPGTEIGCRCRALPAEAPGLV